MKTDSYNDYAKGIQKLSLEDQLKLIELISVNLRKTMNLAKGVTVASEIPNKITTEAMEQARKGHGKKYETVEEMFADMEV